MGVVVFMGVEGRWCATAGDRLGMSITSYFLACQSMR